MDCLIRQMVAVPMLTALLQLAWTHTDILGETIEEIAAQKAGIIKQGIPVVTGNIEKRALEVIKNRQSLGMHLFLPMMMRIMWNTNILQKVGANNYI